jgi:hypothetical protein
MPLLQGGQPLVRFPGEGCIVRCWREVHRAHPLKISTRISQDGRRERQAAEGEPVCRRKGDAYGVIGYYRHFSFEAI